MFKKIVSLWYIVLGFVALWLWPNSCWIASLYVVYIICALDGFLVDTSDIINCPRVYLYTNWAVFQLRAAIIPSVVYTIHFIATGEWLFILLAVLAAFICIRLGCAVSFLISFVTSIILKD